MRKQQNIEPAGIPVRSIPIAPKEPELTEGFRIRNIRTVMNGQPMNQDLHRHDFYFILALTKGSGSHHIDFTKYPVRDHSIFFMRPGQVHELSLKAGCEGYLVEFKPGFYAPSERSSRQLFRRLSNKNWCKTNVHSFRKLEGTLSRMAEEFNDRQDHYIEAIRTHLTMFFIELARNQGSPGHHPTTASYEQQRLEELLELIDKHIAVRKQVSEYADLMNLSSYQLNAVTKSTLGKTGSEVINEHIILEARRYLLATTNQVNQIAYHLGYEDVSYFIRFFRRHTGYTPEAYRLKFS